MCIFVFFCFTILLTCLTVVMYYAIVYLLLIVFLVFLVFIVNSIVIVNSLFASMAFFLLPIALFDIIVDPRWIVGGLSSWDVSSACIIDSVPENFKSKLGIICDNRLVKFSLHCIEICPSKVVGAFFGVHIFLFCFY